MARRPVAGSGDASALLWRSLTIAAWHGVTGRRTFLGSVDGNEHRRCFSCVDLTDTNAGLPIVLDFFKKAGGR
jgi:hypothetical protein